MKRLNEFLPLSSQAKPAPGPLYFCKERQSSAAVQESRAAHRLDILSVRGSLVVHRGVQRDWGVAAHHLGGAAAATAHSRAPVSTNKAKTRPLQGNGGYNRHKPQSSAYGP